MEHKVGIGAFFLMLSAASIILSLRPTISGGAIGVSGYALSPFFIAGVTLFLISVFILAAKQDLEAIVVPTGGGEWNPLSEMYSEDQERSEVALKSGGRLKPTGYYVISGHYPHGDLKAMQKSQDYSIYKFFREHNILPKDMMVEGQSHDTLENTLYALKKIKERERKEGRKGPIDIGIVSYPWHLKRFKDFYERAIKKGMIGKDDFRFHEIATPETEEQRKYEADRGRRWFHRFKLVTMGRYKAKHGGIKHAEPSPLSKVANKIRDALK